MFYQDVNPYNLVKLVGPRHDKMDSHDFKQIKFEDFIDEGVGVIYIMDVN